MRCTCVLKIFANDKNVCKTTSNKSVCFRCLWNTSGGHFTKKKLLNSFTRFWYFATRMTKITYVIILRLVLACIQLCTFSNILTSMEVNSWRPFEIVFSPITQSPYSRYILFHCPLFKTCSESAVVVVIASCEPPGYAWLLRAAEVIKILPRNEETSRGGLVWKQHLG